MKRYMKTTLISLVVLALGAFFFVGCGGKDANQSSANAVEPAVTEILQQLQEKVEIPQCTEIDDADTICTMYDLDTASIAEMGMLKSGNGANADEIIVVKVNDSSAASAVKEAFTLRTSVLSELFADYTPEDMPKIENAATEQNGNYLMLAICADPDSAADVFAAAFKS